MDAETNKGPSLSKQSIVADGQSKLEHIIQAIITGQITGNLHIGDQYYERSDLERLRNYFQIAAPRFEITLLARNTRDDKPDSPYKFLTPYELSDQSIFFGRQASVEKLYKRVIENKVTILQAPSGAGKTSLINAGLTPLLLKNHYLPIYASQYSNVTETIKNCLTSSFLEPKPEMFCGLDLPQTLSGFVSNMVNLTKGVVIFLDQFEYSLSGLSNQTPDPNLLKELEKCSRVSSISIHFLISIRDDYLGALMTALDASVPPFQYNTHSLARMTREEASEAIVGPLVKQPEKIEYDPELVESLLDDLEKGGMQPPLLQLLCSQLYDEAKQSGESRITCQMYKDPSTILGNYLETEMRRFDSDRPLAQRILQELVSAEGENPSYNPEELSKLVGVDVQPVNTVLTRLLNRRLLRTQSDEQDASFRYQIVHDYLAQHIKKEMAPEILEKKSALERLNRKVIDWRVDHTCLSPDTFRGLHPRLLNVTVNDPDSVACLIVSAFFAASLVNPNDGYQVESEAVKAVEHWINVADAIKLDKTPFVDHVCGDADFCRRAKVMNILMQLGKTDLLPWLEEGMNDIYPQVRIQAIRAMEKLQPSGEWRQKLRYERYIPAGRFKMGNDDSDENSDKPADYCILDSYYIDTAPVTSADFERYAKDQLRPGQKPSFHYPPGQENHPVTGISWETACAYARWAGKRLPNEAEWEKAASWDEREHIKRRFPWGDMFDPRLCNTIEGKRESTSPVGEYSPGGDSVYGCQDMAGNVWEWTESPFRGYPFKDIENHPADLNKPFRRVLRGGAYALDHVFAVCTYRKAGPLDPTVSDKLAGLRLAFDASEVKNTH